MCGSINKDMYGIPGINVDIVLLINIHPGPLLQQLIADLCMGWVPELTTWKCPPPTSLHTFVYGSLLPYFTRWIETLMIPRMS